MAFTNKNICLFIFAMFLTMGHLACQALARPLDHETVSSSMRERHEQWMVKHGRVYKDLDEKEDRFHIFKENMEHIDAFNKDASKHSKTFKLGANAFSDLTKDEFKATHLGYTPQSSFQTTFGSNMNMATSTFYAQNVSDAGSSMDWRQQGAVSAVKNQGSCGCCWAFGAVAAVEGINQITTGNLVTFSEQQLLDCTSSSMNCETGGYPEYAYSYIQQTGLEPDSSYPYGGTQGQCSAAQNGGAAVMITGYQRVQPSDPDALMQAVNQQPVSIVIDASDFQSYGSGVYNQGCGTAKTHVVTVIGYGTDESSGQQYWLIKNSWGTTWGEDGYMRLLMDENSCPVTGDATFPVMS